MKYEASKGNYVPYIGNEWLVHVVGITGVDDGRLLIATFSGQRWAEQSAREYADWLNQKSLSSPTDGEGEKGRQF